MPFKRVSSGGGPHATEHESGGSDELDLGALAGTLIEAQTPLTAKGDLLVSDGSTLDNLTAGTNDHVLTADSAQTLGVKWAAAPGGAALIYVAQDSISSLANQTAVQSVFDDANDTVTLAAATKYLFHGQYILATGQTSHTTSLAFALAGGASVNFIGYTALSFQNTAANTNSTGQAGVFVNTVNSTVVIPAQTTNDFQPIILRGIISMNAGGTVTPQVAFSAQPSGTNEIHTGSYLQFEALGPAATDFSGTWA